MVRCAVEAACCACAWIFLCSIKALAKAGSPTFPQNIQECKRAVRWLRKNADRFQLDVGVAYLSKIQQRILEESLGDNIDVGVFGTLVQIRQSDLRRRHS